MKIFILTTKHDATLETYKSFDETVKRIDFINQTFYDGDSFGLFGPPLTDDPYMVDSAVLTRIDDSKIVKRTVYHTFLIFAIDSETGLRTTLN